MNAKNGLAVGLIVAGLFVAIQGWRLAGKETLTQTQGQTEIVTNNSASYGFNWRVFMGLGALFTGIVILAVPSDIGAYKG